MEIGMEEQIKQYLKENLSICIKETSYGFNGRHIIFELQIDGEVIPYDRIVIKNDEG